MNPVLKLQELCKNNLTSNNNLGICSICSSHSGVLEAGIKQSIEDDAPLLIESTSNQVDQYGGYTGMTPKDFLSFVKEKAVRLGYDQNKVILGGDHLGPNRWQNESSDIAMEKAKELVKTYVEAGYRKIHLDASMPLGDDQGKVSEETVAERAAELCEVAEKSYKKLYSGDTAPLYVIGTEVPIPGGTTSLDGTLQPTPASETIKTRETTQEAFEKHGLRSAWDRVIGLVVQPGVEYGNNWVSTLNPKDLSELSNLAEQRNNIVYEAHSTDYQNEQSLRSLVQNHFVILKVGPWVTFAYREGLYSLEKIEQEAFHYSNKNLSHLQETIEQVMQEDDSKWAKYCHGTTQQQYLQRHFGLSDRMRYYWNNQKLIEAQERLFNNFKDYNEGTELGMIKQFLPSMYERIATGTLSLSRPQEIAEENVRDVLRIYHRASGFYEK